MAEISAAYTEADGSLSQSNGTTKPSRRREALYRLIMLAALLLSVIGGLTVMSGSSPLAAQVNPSATRSFDSSTVAPGGTVTVTINVSGYGRTGRVTETLPDGFEYVSTTNPLDTSAAGTDLAQGVVAFNLAGATSFSYQVTASGVESSHAFSGVLLDAAGVETIVGGPTDVTVEAGAVTPDPTPETKPALEIPDLDGLNPETQGIFSPAMAGNDLTYTAEGANDAKVVVRVSPGAEAIVNIDLGMVDPETGQKVNFSLTDGANLDFQIKKTAYGMAEIVVKDGVTLTAGQYNFQLVVNEFENAPANTEDVDIEVTVVIDNEPPTFTDPPESGTVAERARDATIATFSASDVNNQVLSY